MQRTLNTASLYVVIDHPFNRICTVRHILYYYCRIQNCTGCSCRLSDFCKIIFKIPKYSFNQQNHNGLYSTYFITNYTHFVPILGAYDILITLYSFFYFVNTVNIQIEYM